MDYSDWLYGGAVAEYVEQDTDNVGRYKWKVLIQVAEDACPGNNIYLQVDKFDTATIGYDLWYNEDGTYDSITFEVTGDDHSNCNSCWYGDCSGGEDGNLGFIITIVAMIIVVIVFVYVIM